MNDLYVDGRARRHGTGAALIEACAAECAARNVPLLEWETAPDNLRAQSVYDRTDASRTTWVSYSLSDHADDGVAAHAARQRDHRLGAGVQPEQRRARPATRPRSYPRRRGGLRADDLEALLAPVLVADVHGRAEARRHRQRRRPPRRPARGTSRSRSSHDLRLEVRLVVLGVVVLAVLLEIAPLARGLDPRGHRAAPLALERLELGDQRRVVGGGHQRGLVHPESLGSSPTGTSLATIGSRSASMNSSSTRRQPSRSTAGRRASRRTAGGRRARRRRRAPPSARPRSSSSSNAPSAAARPPHPRVVATSS